jgi:hypothetical protein
MKFDSADMQGVFQQGFSGGKIYEIVALVGLSPGDHGRDFRRGRCRSSLRLPQVPRRTF